MSRIRLPHNEVFIVSPFIEIEYLKRQHKFRRMLENFMIEGSDVYILTQIPNEEDIEVFKDFERSTKVVLYFKERLHSKMYLFISNPNIKLSSFYKNHDLGIIGSANLTRPGIPLEGSTNFNFETCYTIPNEKIEEMKDIINQNINESMDLNRVIRELNKKKVKRIIQ